MFHTNQLKSNSSELETDGMRNNGEQTKLSFTKSQELPKVCWMHQRIFSTLPREGNLKTLCEIWRLDARVIAPILLEKYFFEIEFWNNQDLYVLRLYYFHENKLNKYFFLPFQASMPWKYDCQNAEVLVIRDRYIYIGSRRALYAFVLKNTSTFN